MRRVTWILVLLVLSIVPIFAKTGQGDRLALPFLQSAHADDGTPEVTSSANPFAGDTRWIAYMTNRVGNDTTWLIHPDGSDDHQIAADFNGELILPNWSPDGQRIVMVSRDTGGTEPLYEYDLATDSYNQLFACEDPCLGEDEPVYSPDGTKVAFIRYIGPLSYNEDVGDDIPMDCGLWIGDLSTLEVKQITSNKTGCDREYEPHWSPDGTQITYWRDPYAKGKPTGTAVYIINADGTNEQRLTDPAMNAGDSDWSPDGKWIVFSTYPLLEFNFVPVVSNLYLMHPDGSGVEQLTHYETPSTRATQPRYTPDGKWINFTGVTPNDRGLWVMPADGGDPIVLTQGGIHAHGTWQPQ